jgi:hypothetical protein
MGALVYVTVNGSHTMEIPLTGNRAEDRVRLARYLRDLAGLVEKGDLDEELGAGQIG